MLKDIQDWFPLKSYRGRIIALFLFILSLLGYYLWLYPFLTNFDKLYYFKIHEMSNDRKTSIEITIPRYIYGSEIREISVDIENRTDEIVKQLSLQVVLDNTLSGRVSIGSDTLITFDNLRPYVPVSGKIPLSITGLENGDEVELKFLYIEGDQTQIIVPHMFATVQLNRWKGLSNLILEKMLFPPFSLVFIFTVVLISCSLFEDKDEEEQPILDISGIKQTARVLFLAGGAVFLISGIIIGLVTQWHTVSLAMMFSGILLTIISPKRQAKKSAVKTTKIIVSASGDEKEVEIKK